ncbi:hypothetical protein [Pseudomonas mandelii]|uniref:Uncharacterized protein n=1 Tax=Pseudomonas mandelii TaxID=75612 RepID=A0AB36CY96_9PSED|nr:hypothetical protein [Pseudomonas mandelii]NMZ80793.1 hypothetical protein [Pseudomonas mandelii]
MRTQQPANQRGRAAFGLKKAAVDLILHEHTLVILLSLSTYDVSEVLQ